MDKWKDSELAKMKVGGNQKAQEFFESQKDYQPMWNIYDKYNSRVFFNFQIWLTNFDFRQQHCWGIR